MRTGHQSVVCKFVLRFALAVVLCCSASGAALRQQMYDEAIPATGVTLTFTNATIAGSFLAVGTRPSDGSLNQTVTAGGQEFTKVVAEPGASEHSLVAYVLYNAPSVTQVVISGGDTSDQQRAFALEFTGMPTSGSIEDTNSATGFQANGILDAGNVTTDTDNALLIFWGATDSDEFHNPPDGQLPVPSSGWNLVDWSFLGTADPDKTAVMWKVAGAAGSYGGTLDDEQSPIWVAIIGAFTADSGGGGESFTPSVTVSGISGAAGVTFQ